MAAPKIFICYRRADSADYANVLREKLGKQLPNHGVFMDLGIQPGDRFPDRLKEAIATCKVLLVVIGPQWLEMTDEHGHRRLDNERDYVRVEIAAALEREELVVIPVLVRGAKMPAAAKLPEELRPLVELAASIIRDDRWGDGPRDEDVRELAAVLERLLGGDSTWLARAAGVLASAAKKLRRTSRRARLAVAALLVLVVAGVLALGQSPDPPTVRIGVIHWLSGDGADSAKEARAGVQYAIDYINGTGGPDLGLPLRHGGGLPAIGGGARLAAVDENISGSDIRQARCDVRQAVNRLDAKGVAAVIGAYESTLTLQAIVAADRDEIPLVTDASSATPLTERDGFRAKVQTRCGGEEPDVTPSPWFSRIGPTDAQYAQLFADLIAYERGQHRIIDRVAILSPSKNIIGNADATDASTAISALGGADVKRFHYDPTTAPRAGSACSLGYADELKKRIAAIAGWRAQVVIAVGYTAQAVATVQAMGRIGYKPQLLTFGAGFARPDFAKLVEQDNPACDLPSADASDVITRAAFSPLSAGTLAAEAARYFQKTYHREMTSVAAVAFTAAMTVAQAIDAAGKTGHRPVQSTLRQLRVSPVETILLGGISFDDNGQNGDVGGVLLQMQSGRYVPIFPRKLAERFVPVLPPGNGHT